MSLFFPLSLSLSWIWGGFSPSGQTSIVTDHKEKLGVDENLSGTPQIVVRVSNPLPPTREMWGPWESPRVQGGRGDPHHVKSPLYLKSGKRISTYPAGDNGQLLGGARVPGLEPRSPQVSGPPCLCPLPSAQNHRVPDLPSPVSSSAKSHTYPVRVLREPVHLLRSPRHGCSLREGERGRTRWGLVAAGLRAAGAPRTCDWAALESPPPPQLSAGESQCASPLPKCQNFAALRPGRSCEVNVAYRRWDQQRDGQPHLRRAEWAGLSGQRAGQPHLRWAGSG